MAGWAVAAWGGSDASSVFMARAFEGVTSDWRRTGVGLGLELELEPGREGSSEGWWSSGSAGSAGTPSMAARGCSANGGGGWMGVGSSRVRTGQAERVSD